MSFHPAVVVLVTVVALGAPVEGLAGSALSPRSRPRATAKAPTPAQRKIKRNRISVVNANTGEKVENLPLIWENPKNRNEKRILKSARKRLAEMFRDRRTGRQPRLPDRLLWYLYVVGYHYDKPIRLVSGLRSGARKTSRHSDGHAADFRVEGVDSEKLWGYLKSRFKKVGLGYYPTSKFVHMDVRDRAHYWIDDSGPGEPANYRSGVAQPAAEWREQRARERHRAADRKERGRKQAKK